MIVASVKWNAVFGNFRSNPLNSSKCEIHTISVVGLKPNKFYYDGERSHE